MAEIANHVTKHKTDNIDHVDNKELAGFIVILGVADSHESNNNLFWIADRHRALTCDELCRDWRVAGALLEKTGSWYIQQWHDVAGWGWNMCGSHKGFDNPDASALQPSLAGSIIRSCVHLLEEEISNYIN